MNYETSEVIAGTKFETTQFAQPSDKTPSQYAEELVTKTFRYGDDYE